MHKFIRSVGLVSFVLFGFLLAATATLQKEEKHSDPSRSCVSGECHPDILKHKYLHGPLKVKIGQCTVCHAPLPGTDHKFTLVETEAKLCRVCHKSVATEGLNLHDPVAKGECLGCHDPHGSEEPHQVRKSPTSKLCYECHKKAVLTQKFHHTPVDRGECLGCHLPHGSKDKKLLDATGRQLCLKKCHEKMRPVQEGGKGQNVHLSSEDCSRCHRPHESNQLRARLTKPSAVLCLEGCHKEFKEGANKFNHWANEDGSGCIDCHRAHDSTFGRLLRKTYTELCLSCHEDLKAQIEAAKYRHIPTSDHSCRSCHLPHGSKYSDLLFAEYPLSTLSAYDPAKYVVCFTCHDEKIVGERYVDDLTNFRNGRLSLHYLHVNRGEEGHTCRACHAEHASNQPARIREQAPSGHWDIPIRFTQTKTGGSCLTGCHKEYTYDRVNPVQLNAK